MADRKCAFMMQQKIIVSSKHTHFIKLLYIIDNNNNNSKDRRIIIIIISVFGLHIIYTLFQYIDLLASSIYFLITFFILHISYQKNIIIFFLKKIPNNLLGWWENLKYFDDNNIINIDQNNCKSITFHFPKPTSIGEMGFERLLSHKKKINS